MKNKKVLFFGRYDETKSKLLFEVLKKKFRFVKAVWSKNQNQRFPKKVLEYKGDYIIKTGSSDNYANIESYLNMRENMVNEPVKVFLGTTAASEGFSLFGYRETHILEPHFNLSLLEQVIGRVIRFESHKHLPAKERNVTVYYYASTIKNQETVDLYKYRLSEQKAVTSGKVMKVLKENALDCHLNYDLNNNSDNKYLNKLNWSGGFYRKDIGYKVIDK